MNNNPGNGLKCIRGRGWYPAPTILIALFLLIPAAQASVFTDWDNNGSGGFVYARPNIQKNGTYLLGPVYFEQQPVPALSGSVTLDLGWTDNYLTQIAPPASGSVMIEYDLDGQQAVSGYIPGPPFTFTLDTTQIPDGTHVLSVRIVDSTGATWAASRIRGEGHQVIIQNSGPINGAQKLPVPGFAYLSHHEPTAVDWVQYPGSPQHNNVHAYPYHVVAPSSDPAQRTVYNWFIESLTEPRVSLYGGNPEFMTTQKGGVGIQYFNPEASAFLESSIPSVQRHNNYDGGRDDNKVSPYSNVVPAPSGATWAGAQWIGVDLSGRIFKINTDGSVVTLAGLHPDRLQLPYEFTDLNVSLGQVAAHSQAVGTGMAPGDYGSPNDLVFDPRNSNILYVTDTTRHAIWKVDFSPSNPAYTLYAGVPGAGIVNGQLTGGGYVNGPALSAKFNEPTSIIMAPDGTMYVADYNNGAIRKISSDGSTVSTLVGYQPGQTVPSLETVASNRDTYSSPTPVSFASALTPYPHVIRFDSSGNIVVGENIAMVVRLINLSNQTLSRIYTYGGGDSSRIWIWLDVDTMGTIGPKDDILMTLAQGGSGNTSLFRFSEDGSYGVSSQVDYADNGPVPDGPANSGFVVDQSGHYPWFIAISKTEGRFITMGFANVGVASWRILQSGETANIDIVPYAYPGGRAIWGLGTLMGFPWGGRPSFESLMGTIGNGHLGSSVCPTFDDLMVKYPDDASLGAYIQAGMCGSTPRPEITGNDLRDLIYFIRRSSLQGGSLSPVSPGPTIADPAAPVISNVAAAYVSATSVRVTWTTDKPALGFVAWGSTSDYNGWSPLESGYTTSHSVLMTGLPNVALLHYAVVAKDIPGLQSNTADQTIVNPNPSAPSPPTPPIAVTAKAGNGQVQITWDPVFGAASYNLYWTSTAGDPKNNGIKIAGVTTPANFPGTNGVAYTFAVTAVNSAGESAESALVNATPSASAPPLPPGGSPPPVSVTSTTGFSVRVYPNPWRADKHAGNPTIAFDGLIANTTIKIFTTSGHKIKELTTTQPKTNWDLTNDAGDKVASGIYVYLITDSAGDKVKGKVAVIK